MVVVFKPWNQQEPEDRALVRQPSNHRKSSKKLNHHNMQHLDSLAVHIRQLFHFQGALQASGKIESPENGKIHWDKNTTRTLTFPLSTNSSFHTTPLLSPEPSSPGSKLS